MTNRKILTLYAGLISVSNLKGIKFIYAVSKNKKTLQPEIEAIQEAGKHSEEYAKYEKARLELCEYHAKKDSEGKPIIATDHGFSRYVMISNDGFGRDLEDLRKEHKVAIEDDRKSKKTYEEFLDEENKVEIHKIPMDQISEEITAEQFEAISTMIEDY